MHAQCGYVSKSTISVIHDGKELQAENDYKIKAEPSPNFSNYLGYSDKWCKMAHEKRKIVILLFIIFLTECVGL